MCQMFTSYSCVESVLAPAVAGGIMFSGCLPIRLCPCIKNAFKEIRHIWLKCTKVKSHYDLMMAHSHECSICVALSQFRVCLVRRPHSKAIYVTTPCEGSSKCSCFSLCLEDAQLLSFVASHIPRFRPWIETQQNLVVKGQVHCKVMAITPELMRLNVTNKCLRG